VDVYTTNVTGLIDEENTLFFEATGSTILALQQIVVVEKEALPEIDVSALKTQWTNGVFAGVENNLTVIINNKESKTLENVTVEIYSNETSEVIATQVIDSLAPGDNTIIINDATIREITEKTVWPEAQNNKIKYTVLVKYADVELANVSFDKIVAYNGYLNKTYAYNGSDNKINRNYTVTGDVIISTQPVDVYADQYSRQRNETWDISLPDDSTLVKAFLYFNYNWDTSYFPDGWTLTFNGEEITNDYIFWTTDQGNLGMYGAYQYGILVFDVSEYFVNGENTFDISKTGNCALYPSTLVVLYNATGSNTIKEVYFSDLCDVFYPYYNKVGYEDALKAFINYDGINTTDIVDAIWYSFSGSSSMNVNLSFNGKVVENAFDGYTSDDCKAYEYDVTDYIGADNEAIYVTSAQSTTTVAYEQILVVTRTLKDASVSVDNDTLELDVYDEFTIAPTTTPEGLPVTYTSSDESVVTVDADGKVTAVGGGSATITASVGGDGVYAYNSTEIAVTVNKLDTILTVDNVRTVYNTTCFVVATLTDANGEVLSGVKVKINVGDLTQIAKTDENGQVSLDITALEAGEYTIGARSSGIDGIYSESKTYAKAIVYPEKLDATLTIPDVYVIGNSSGVVVATLTDSEGNAISGVNVKIVVGDLTQTTKTDENGQVSLDISDLAPGEYKISARSSGVNKLYKEAKTTAKAIVSEEKLDATLTVPDVFVIGNSSAVVVATLTDSDGKAISGVNVKIVVGDLTQTIKTDENGQVSLDISGLAPGEYKISARSSGVNYIYKEAKATAKAIVSEEKLDATLTVPDVIAVGNSSAVVVATLKDSYGNIISGVNVKIVVGDLSVVAKTDENGQVSLDISDLAPGQYKISARSSGVNGIYKEAKTSAKAIISEEKLDTTLTIPDVTVDGSSSALVVATLKDSYKNLVSGVNVKIVVGDLSKTAKTDENGQVSLDISDLAPGEYKISARSSAVSDLYNEAKATAKAIVYAN
jgi:hypothetical protein